MYDYVEKFRKKKRFAIISIHQANMGHKNVYFFWVVKFEARSLSHFFTLLVSQYFNRFFIYQI